MHKMGSSSNDRSSCNQRFMQPLLPDFLNSFMIPSSFVKKLQGHHLQTVVLVTENDPHRHWVVNVESDRLFKQGWKDFCVHHGLQVGDFVVFTHHSHFLFHVTVFDPVSACERFPPPPPPPPDDLLEPVLDTKEPKECEADVVATPVPSKQGYPPCEIELSPYSVRKAIIYLPADFVRGNGLKFRRCELEIIDRKRRVWPVVLNYKKSSGQSYIKRGWKPFLVANRFKPGDALCFQLLKGGNSPTLKCCRAKRVMVEPKSACKTPPGKTQVDGATTIKSDKFQSQYLSFHAKLTPYALKSAIIYLPADFVRESSLKYKRCEVKILDEKEMVWQVGLNFRSDGQAYLCRGWRDVQTANCFVRGDRICFQLLEAAEQPNFRCYRTCKRKKARCALSPANSGRNKDGAISSRPRGSDPSPNFD